MQLSLFELRPFHPYNIKSLGINTSNCLLWELIGPSGVLETYLNHLEIAKMHSGPMGH